MARTILPEARAALIALLQARPGLENKQVVYGWPGVDKLQNECIYLGNRSPSQHDPASIKTGRRFRDEEATFQVIATTDIPGHDAQTAELAALALGEEIEDCLADDYKLGGNVPGLISALITGVDVMYQYTESGCAGTAVYTVTVKARLT